YRPSSLYFLLPLRNFPRLNLPRSQMCDQFPVRRQKIILPQLPPQHPPPPPPATPGPALPPAFPRPAPSPQETPTSTQTYLRAAAVQSAPAGPSAQSPPLPLASSVLPHRARAYQTIIPAQ